MRVIATLQLATLLLLTACTGDIGIAETQREQRVANNPDAMLRIARAAEIAGDPASAEAFYQRAADLRPQDATVSVSLARSLAEQGRNDAAVRVLREAHGTLPRNILVAATLGRLLVAVQQPQEALAAFEDGLRVAPQSISLLIGRGVVLDAIGQHLDAQASYHAVLALAPHNVAAQNNLALSLILSGRADQGEAMLQALRPAADPADAATISSNLARAAGGQAGADRPASAQRLTASDIVFPALPAQGGAVTAGGAGTVGAAPGTPLP